jgi:glycosyltransferase involved in cell wall biosynthesis
VQHHDILGIDASNIQGGGGVTHLRELLSHANPEAHGFDRVIVWGGAVVSRLPERHWLVKEQLSLGNLSLREQFVFRTRGLRKRFVENRCDLLFSPGGTFVSSTIPYVSMSQNMLLYEVAERRRFPWGWNRIRYNLLRIMQRRSFNGARGIVFISEHARDSILKYRPKWQHKLNTVIYHGVDERFSGTELSRNKDPNIPLQILYVSRANYYKHQWNVVAAVKKLNSAGIPCRLRLVGGGSGAAQARLNQAIAGAASIEDMGAISYDEIDREYRCADIFVFASTCENMPNILLEAMSAGLPIASSSYGPMPEILGDAGVYFDPLDIDSIVRALGELIRNESLRIALSRLAYQRSTEFTWEEAANRTFRFFASCLEPNRV